MVTFLKLGSPGALVALALLSGCAASGPRGKTLTVPPEMRRQAAPAAAPRDPRAPPVTQGPAAPDAPAPSPRAERYVVRMAEAGRVWEVELPESSGGYEVRVPLNGMGGPSEQLTAADEEMLSDALADRAGDKAQGAGVKEGAKAADKAPATLDARAAARRKSYLGGIAKVSEMYASRRYELALIEVVNLETDYPNDARLLSMKGSLYLKLGKARLARETWEKALTINPDDAGVAEALRSVALGEE